MISLAQYFAERAGEDFAPFRAIPAAKSGTARAPAAPAKAPSGERRTAARPLKILDANLALPAEPLARRPAEAAPVIRKAFPAPREAAAAEPAFQAMRPAFVKRAPRPAATPVAEPLVSASELEAERSRFAQERAAWDAEREEHKGALEQAVVAARLEGMLNGRRMAREEMLPEIEARTNALREDLDAEHRLAMANAREEWTMGQADRLAAQVTQGLGSLEAAIREAFLGVLRPLARDARQRQTMDELVEAIRTIALDGRSFKIAASGPSDLLEQIGARLGEQAGLLSFVIDETSTDIRIDADNTVIESRLSSWQQALDEALS